MMTPLKRKTPRTRVKPETTGLDKVARLVQNGHQATTKYPLFNNPGKSRLLGKSKPTGCDETTNRSDGGTSPTLDSRIPRHAYRVQG